MAIAWFKSLVDRFWRYDAFISYAHDDGEKFATGLLQELRKDPVFQVCRDQDGEAFTPGTDLKLEIERRVRMSKYLILVATPKAMSSDWVAQEVRLSVEAGRSPIAIIAFNPSGECFGVVTKDSRIYFLNVDELIKQRREPVDEENPFYLDEQYDSFRSTLDLEVKGVTSLAFSPDGSLMATGSGTWSATNAPLWSKGDGILRVWTVTCSSAEFALREVPAG